MVEMSLGYSRNGDGETKAQQDDKHVVVENKPSYAQILSLLKTVPKRDTGIDVYISQMSKSLLGHIIITAREKFKSNPNSPILLQYMNTAGWKYNSLRQIKQDVFGSCNTHDEVNAALAVWNKVVVDYFDDKFWQKIAFNIDKMLKFAGSRVAPTANTTTDHKQILKSDGKRRPVLALDTKKLSMDMIKILKASGALLPNRIDAVWQDSVSSDTELQLIELGAILETRFAYQYGITD